MLPSRHTTFLIPENLSQDELGPVYWKGSESKFKPTVIEGLVQTVSLIYFVVYSRSYLIHLLFTDQK